MVSVARHGYSMRGARRPEYDVWSAMIQRCANPKNPFYKHYGARGISVHPAWRGAGGFDTFIAHIGPRPTAKHTIDRENNDGNYEPGNVRWATRAVQQRNTTLNTMLTLRGETLCVSDWAERVGVRRGMIFSRLGRGWSPEAAVFTPSKKPPREQRSGQ